MEKGDGGDFPPEKVQPDTTTGTGTGTVTVTASSDFPLKKLARQLDFTAFCSASTGVVLPEHPQQQQQQQKKPQPQPQAQSQPLPQAQPLPHTQPLSQAQSLPPPPRPSLLPV
ncbi:hypothetical protein BVC80_9069g106 [Macleaya cordata]|uniref:Uncharacterized protein n=1 Tax=Macleaya cordata TaxID=56857 RepID=A0A200PP36_MACCD|nr:hypothetical protein BVC80_9069g106 [Macleaya cordata]